MTIAKVIEISSTSPESFEDAIRVGIARVAKTVNHIRSAWVKEQTVEVVNDQVTNFRVNLNVTFIVEE